MPKIKVKEIKSIYTNVDENDSSFDLVRTSINLRHLKGYAQAEPRHLQEYDIPNLTEWFGDEGWEYETGTYCTLTNDSFTEDPVADKRDVLVLIAINVQVGLYYRRILFKDLTNNSDWWEPTVEGNLAGATLHRTFLFTTKVGKTFFQVENGRLKIYMPHDCFWLGLIDRDTNFDHIDFTGFYCDRLVEPFDYDNQYIKVNGIPYIEVPQYTQDTDVTCGDGRRLGISYALEFIGDGSTYVDEIRLTTLAATTSTTMFWHGGHWESGYRSGFLYRFEDEHNIMVSPDSQYSQEYYMPGTSEPPDPSYWVFLEGADTAADCLVIDRSYALELFPLDMNGDKVTWLDFADCGEWPVRRGTGTETTDVLGWKVNKSVFDSTTFVHSGVAQSIDVSGFEVAKGRNYSIITTAVLDDREEVIISSRKGIVSVEDIDTHYAVQFYRIHLPKDMNKRVTRIRFYWKILYHDLDYTLHKEIDLLDTEGDGIWEPFYISTLTDTGTTLGQNIAFLYDAEEPQKYKVLTGFRSFNTESGVSIALANDNYTGAHYSVLGGGVLQPDIMYSQNLLPISGISKMHAVSTINDRFAVFTDNTMYVITVDQIEGALVFTPTETVALGIKNRPDVVSVQGGAIVNTRNGIYLTSGTSQQLLSEPINDIVKYYYSTSQLLYNKYKNELYYRPNTTQEDLYRFRFEDNTWERLNVSVYDTGSLLPVMSGDALGGWLLTNAIDIFIDLNGDRVYLETDKMWVYSLYDDTMPQATLVFNRTDLGEPSIDKLLNYFDLDYVGDWKLYVYMDSANWSIELPPHPYRIAERVYIPLQYRKAFNKFYMQMTSVDHNVILYGLEIDFQILRQRSYA